MNDALGSFLRDGIRRIQHAQAAVPESPSDEGLQRAALDAWWAGLTVGQRMTVFEVTRATTETPRSPFEVRCPVCGSGAGSPCLGEEINGDGLSFKARVRPHTARCQEMLKHGRWND